MTSGTSRSSDADRIVAGAEIDAPSAESLRPLLIDLARDDASQRFVTFLPRYVFTILPIGLALWLYAAFPSMPMLALAAVVTGFAQNALGLLMHEGSHYFFHEDRRKNDLIADVLVCLPIFNTVMGYRVPHLDHHRYAGETRDPYGPLYSGYKSRAHLIAGLAADMLLISAVGKFWERYADRSSATRLADGRGPLPLVGAQAALFAVYTLATGHWYAYFVIWLLPLMTLAQLINRVRTIAEHTPDPGDRAVSRATVPGILEYLLIAPYGYAYHFEHHLAPTVPYYRLADAHRLLERHGVRFTRRDLTGGYLRTFWRVAKTIESTK
jgi:fatty acid desaturase